MFNLFKRKKISGKTIVAIGGGTGMFSLLSGLKSNVKDNSVIKVIVTTMDNGGSSGKLITQYGTLPPGDVRNCMVALSNEAEVLSDLFQYRFDKKLDNHNFGNLLITALNDITGNFGKAVKVASKILRIKGEIIPVSLEKNHLMAELEDGRILEGETAIDTTKNKKIAKLFLKDKTNPNKRVVEVIRNADIIIFGPGDLYTSILPNILFPSVRNAIKNNKNAKKVLVTAVMSKPGETDDFKVSDFKDEFEKYLGSSLTHIVANSKFPSNVSLKRYVKENKFPIILDKENLKNCEIVSGEFIDKEKVLRHDPERLANAIKKLI